jgi:N-acetylneuraminic acid mutarotase
MHIEEKRQSGDIPGAVVYHCSEVVENKMYILLGMKERGRNHTQVHIYDMITGRWEEVISKGKPPSPRCLACSCVVGTKIYVFGGYQVHTNSPHTVFNGMFVFDTETLEWDHLEASGLSPDPRAASSMIEYENQLYIFGGSQGKQVFFGDLYSFDLDTHAWNAVETYGDVRPQRLCCHTGKRIGDVMYVFGGLTSNEVYEKQKPSNSLWALNLASRRWKKVNMKGSIPGARCCHSMIAMEPSLVVAGGGDLMSKMDYDNNVYIFNTRSEKWSKLTGFFGNTMPKCVGLSISYSAKDREFVLFGGKNANGELLDGLYSMPVENDKNVTNNINELGATPLFAGRPSLMRGMSLKNMKLNPYDLKISPSKESRGRSRSLRKDHPVSPGATQATKQPEVEIPQKSQIGELISLSPSGFAPAPTSRRSLDVGPSSPKNPHYGGNNNQRAIHNYM